MVLRQQEGQRRRRSFRRLFSARSILRRRSVANQSVSGPVSVEPSLKPVQEYEEEEEEELSVAEESQEIKKTTTRLVHSFRVSHDADRHDIEISITEEEEEVPQQREGEEVPNDRNEEKEQDNDTLHSFADSLSTCAREHSLQHVPSWKTTPAHVEFQDDNNHVFTFEYARSFFKANQIPDKQVDDASIQVLDSFEQSLKKQSTLEYSEDTPDENGRVYTTTPDHVSLQSCDRVSVQSRDLSNIQHSVQNETMSEVSALTHKSSHGLSYSESESVASSDESFATPTYPDVLMLRAKTGGTHDITEEEVEEASQAKSEQSVTSKGEVFEEDSKKKNDWDDEHSKEYVDGNDGKDGDASEEEEEDDDDHDKEDEEEYSESPTAIEEEDTDSASESNDKDQDKKDKRLDALDVMIQRTMDTDEDAFVDIDDDVGAAPSLSYEESVHDDDDDESDYKSYVQSVGDESAYISDDNNVPFVDPIDADDIATIASNDELQVGWSIC